MNHTLHRRKKRKQNKNPSRWLFNNALNRIPWACAGSALSFCFPPYVHLPILEPSTGLALRQASVHAPRSLLYL